MRNFKLPVLQRNGKSSGKFRFKCLIIMNVKYFQSFLVVNVLKCLIGLMKKPES